MSQGRVHYKTIEGDALKKSELELRDVLISQGYPADDISQVPEETMKLAKVKSGYDQSKSQYEM